MNKSFLKNNSGNKRRGRYIGLGASKKALHSTDGGILNLIRGGFTSVADDFANEIVPVLDKLVSHLKYKGQITKIKLNGTCEGSRCQHFNMELKNLQTIIRNYKINIDDFKEYLMWKNLSENEKRKLTRVVSYIFNVDLNVSTVTQLINSQNKKTDWLRDLMASIMISCLYTRWCCDNSESYC